MQDGLEQSQAVLRAILESPKDIVIFALDRDYCYLAFNENHSRTMKAIWGVDITIGLNMLHAIGRDDDREKARRNFDRALAGESFVLVEEYGDERINRRYYEDVYSPIRDRDGQVIGLTLYLTDITEQRNVALELERYREHLEELVERRTQELEAAHRQLLHAQKLESLGVLAGGIAHDFNNLLAVVLGSVDLAFKRHDSTAGMIEQLHHIRAAVVQASALTDQLLAYSGRGKATIQAIDLSELVNEMIDLLGIALPKSVELESDLLRSLPAVEADAAQLRQVVMNFVTNAAEAITKPNGTIIVRTYMRHADRALLDRAHLGEALAAGPYVCLEVEDDGCGMSEEIQRKMFDPFFSSKFTGRGLGLAAVLGIARSHRAAIVVDSRLEHGTRMHLMIPVSPRSAKPRLGGRTAGVVSDFRSDALVLLVDDDERVRSVLAELLISYGMRVLQAADGQAACAHFAEHADEIALVLLDVTMPGWSGIETLQRLSEVRPDVRAILLSGYTEQDVGQRLAFKDQVSFLHKPFHMHELVTAIEALLRDAKSSRV
jgi:PAS domain S-box-containing protein